LTQQPSSQISLPPARSNGVVVDTPPASEKCVCAGGNISIGKPGAGTKSLQEHKDRFALWSVCECPEKFQQNYRPYNTDYTENQCLICGNLSGREYD